ncbi:MAG: DUF4920 domain-containing protein [Bacteroidota bacterium]
MKSLIAISFTLGLILGVLQVSAQKMVFPKDSVSADGNMSYHGQRINEEGAVAISDIDGLLEDIGEEAQVKLSGTIEAACKVKGCWMTMALPNGEEMRVKFKDYGFFVPTDAAGKTAVMEGKLSVETLSVEEARHLAEDAGMSKEEAEKAITEPKKELSLEATGVIVKAE